VKVSVLSASGFTGNEESDKRMRYFRQEEDDMNIDPWTNETESCSKEAR
jgi:hypothetical protein